LTNATNDYVTTTLRPFSNWKSARVVAQIGVPPAAA
jgi:hypothetical protein